MSALASAFVRRQTFQANVVQHPTGHDPGETVHRTATRKALRTRFSEQCRLHEGAGSMKSIKIKSLLLVAALRDA